ncbi:MAG TPA: polysaccharide biosynthesis/export family protein [Planctomycetota bacterium]|nr:polysaccharide biosynthesis/export family protein [Planctomycetota bacterium]
MWTPTLSGRDALPPMPRIVVGISLALALSLSACQTAGGPNLAEIAPEVNRTLEPNAVVLSTGDELTVTFAYQPTWNQTVTIAPDGSASFLGIGRLIAAGMSPGKLNQTLTDAYSRVFDNPELVVVLKGLGARNVYVMGEVKEPGEQLLGSDRRLTLLEALARAGGPKKESAYLAHTLLMRWNASTGKQIAWKIDAREEHWDNAQPLYLQAYDVVWIPNTPIDQVGIWVDNYIRRMIPFPYLFTPAAP